MISLSLGNLFILPSTHCQKLLYVNCYITNGPPQIDPPDHLWQYLFHGWSLDHVWLPQMVLWTIYSAISGLLCHRWSSHATAIQMILGEWCGRTE